MSASDLPRGLARARSKFEAWRGQRRAGERIPESLWRMALRRTLPVSVKEATHRRVRRAAELKANHAIAYADAFAVATALEFHATLLTGDPEIKPLEGERTWRCYGCPSRVDANSARALMPRWGETQ